MLITGDLGFTVFEDFRREFPKQYLNAGVQEAQLMGLATGLALSGKIIFVYSIIPFATARCAEQIRNDICVHNANVKIVGVGQGYSYSVHGPTHHAVEDIGLLRSFPNMRIVSPGDPGEVRAAVRLAAVTPGPFYLRLGKKGEPDIHAKEPILKVGKGIVVSKGTDVVLYATGNMLEETMKVAGELKKKKVSVGVVSMPFVKPIDASLIRRLAKNAKVVATIEEHNVLGGLGSAVAEVLAESPYNPKFQRFGVPDEFARTVGSHAFMRDRIGLSVPKLVSSIQKLIREA